MDDLLLALLRASDSGPARISTWNRDA